MPDVINQPTVLIITLSGSANVSNPLLLYKFQQFPLNETWFPADYPGDGMLNTHPTTLRTPDDNGTSSPDSVNNNLGGCGLMANTVSLLPIRPSRGEAEKG
jgi:tyrosinase